MFSTPSLGFDFVLLLHCFFVCLGFFGAAVALIWLYREAKADLLRKVMFWTLIVGIVGSLVTAPFVCFMFGGGYYDNDFGRNGMMMNWMDNGDFSQLSTEERNQKMQERMEKMMEMMDLEEEVK